MRFFVGVTDFDWFRFLASRPDIDEVNFWQPSGRGSFKALQPGEPFLFKLHSPHNESALAFHTDASQAARDIEAGRSSLSPASEAIGWARGAIKRCCRSGTRQKAN